MLGQYTFGLREIKYTEILDDGVYFGNAVGGKSSASDAGAIDLKANKQMYSLKARFNVFALEDVLPAKSAGTKGKVTITPTVTTAGAGTIAIKIGGTDYAVAITDDDSTATKVCDAIRAAINDPNYELTGTSTLVCEQREAFAYSYDASDWAATYTKSGDTGTITFSASKTTDAVAPTAYNVKFELYHCDSADGTFAKLFEASVPCEELEAHSSPAFEITMPSNCKRFVYLKVTADADATAGALLCAIEPKN